MSKWCECKPLTTTEALNLGASVDWSLLHKKICPRCQKPIKPKSKCKGVSPYMTGKPAGKTATEESLKSKRKLPEKMDVDNKDDVMYRVFAKVINEIIDYLKEA